MKYAQMLMGLLVGTALGGSVVAATGHAPLGKSTGALDRDAVKEIVRETISEEPKLIMDSVQKYQENLRKDQMKGASDALKDKTVRDMVYDADTAATYGPADSKHVIVEFFDYNCPACKAQYKIFTEVLEKDKSLRILFREYPIFGEVSEANARIGVAVSRIAPEKYIDFHSKMMAHEGRAAEKDALGYAKAIGLDVEKVKAEAKKPEVQAALENNRAIAEKIHVQGTPTLVVGDEVIPHAAPADELLKRLGAK